MDNLFEDIFKKLQRTLYSPDLRKLMQTPDNYKTMFADVELKMPIAHGTDGAGRNEGVAKDQLAACEAEPAKMNSTDCVDAQLSDATTNTTDNV